VLVPDVRTDRAPALLAGLGALGLVTDPDDPATSVVACVGSTGCEAGRTDTLADARRLIDQRPRAADADAVTDVPSVHVSGCTKRCASRQVHDVTLVGVGRGRYDILVRDPRSGGERLARRAAPFDEAVRGT
jgi:precorrin-3B synthase